MDIDGIKTQVLLDTGTGSSYASSKLIVLRNKVVFLMNLSRCEFYTDLVSSISGDQRKLFDATKKLLKSDGRYAFSTSRRYVSLG